MWNSEALNEHLLDGWEKSYTKSGVPFYTNHKTEKTEWDHPILVKTMEELVDMDAIKYAAYRTAMKLRFLQKRLKLDLLDLPTLTTVLDRHGYGTGTEADKHIPCQHAHKLLTDMFTICRKTLPPVAAGINSETAAELLLNFMLNLYDKTRTGRVRISAIKVALATLCSARLAEKYRFFFKHICDRSQHVSRQRMGLFLQDMMQIIDVLNESGSFGGLNVGPAVDNCFAQSWSSSAGVTEDELSSWLFKEPQTVVWLPTMHRMAAAESIKHEAKCSACKAIPIIGFRYRCLKCFNYDLCQQCFFIGRTSKNHKAKHPTQEYCLATSAKEDTKALMRTIRNNFSKKHRNKRKLRYVPIQGTGEPYDADRFSVGSSEVSVASSSPRVSRRQNREPQDDDDEVVDDDDGDEIDQTWQQPQQQRLQQQQPPMMPHVTVMSDPAALSNNERQQLSGIVRQLEKENRDLMLEIERVHLTSPPPPRSLSSMSSTSSTASDEWLRDERERLAAKQEVLEAHNKQLELQLGRLRDLIKAGSTSPITPSARAARTPKPTSTPAEGYDFATPESLQVDTTFGSVENSLGQTRYELPSPNRSRYFPDEEAQLEELMEKLDKAYTISAPDKSLYEPASELEEMYRAANNIGDAFSQFVTPAHAGDGLTS